MGSATTNTYDANDRISGEAFDDAGNVITNASGHTFAYDGENRLTNAVIGSATVRLIYNGDGQRVRKSVINGGATNTTLHLVDDLNPTGYPQVLEELSATNATPIRLYTYGTDLISQRAADGTTHYHGHDGHGTVRYLTAAGGAVTDRFDYDAFGVPVHTSGTTTNFYRHTGEQFDPDLGLYYLRTRYLNPGQGRFINRDRFEGTEWVPTSLHAYSYVHHDPVNFSDPTGEVEFSVVGITVSINVQGNLRSISSAAGQGALQRVRESLGRLGIQSVRQLRLSRLPGQQTHHLIERRLFERNPALRNIFRSVDDIPGLNLSRAEHQLFTNAWRRELPYSGQAGYLEAPTLERILEAAEVVYANHPQLLRAVYLSLL